MSGFNAKHTLGYHFFADANAVNGSGEFLRPQNVLNDVIAKVKRVGRLPFSAIFKELIEILPVALGTESKYFHIYQEFLDL